MRRTISKVVTTVPLLLLLGCVQQPLSPPAEPTAYQQEQLLARPPNDWQIVYQLNTQSTRIVDYLPPGEAATDWQTKLSFESHQALTDIDPIEALISEVAKVRETCSSVNDFNLFSGLENNYRTSTRLLMCSNNAYTKRGEVSMLKVIQGNEYLYIIRLIKRIPPFETGEPTMPSAEIATWSNYLRNISVCDPNQSAHACSATKP
ncbi:MAG: hypothetical protein HQ497_10440 [SAR86 cluster bacterium]|uniref:Uncharacterized protein n=1 Tax=SAR86 cluster bacterium TaxID=2030880 RepID=A0A972W0L0_9GAMM|nr:hypothetical protein [SAR86 cluster bacterium]